MASIRKGKKLLGRLKVGNRVLKDPRSIKKEAVKYFKNLYSTEDSINVRHNGTGFPRLTQQ